MFPVIVLTDNVTRRVFLPELTGQWSASFLQLSYAGTFAPSEIPTLRPGNGHCAAFNDVLTAALRCMLVDSVDTTNAKDLKVKPESEKEVCKFSIISITTICLKNFFSLKMFLHSVRKINVSAELNF